ncbi:hypothetical protein KIN_24690 [Litoreibacter roseus]|uniref:HTH LytTR-type domain-containing protein n=2 Tax=Litoreibacter roseus TaxID=2601869 RepID=A0A6N6JH01_9RHOB|nr:hypothetical protein KIN_24690 [Litoreibacter roseus]
MYETTGLIARLLYWFTIVGFSIPIAFGLQVARRVYVPERFLPLGFLAAALVFGAVMTPFIFGLNALFLPHRLADLLAPLPMFGFTAATFLGVSGIVTSVRSKPAAANDTAVVDSDTASAIGTVEIAFLKRLNPENRTGLMRLAMQDHYVEAHCDGGRQMILLRMSDAIQELQGFNGLQVHRSHWVATDAVAGHERVDGRLYLVMRDGARVPVSRTYRDAIRSSGLI